MSIEDVARGVRNWALANRMMGAAAPSSPPVDMTLVRNAFGAVGVPNAVSILQDRGIVNVGVNRVRKEIVVFTQRRLRASDHKLLSLAAYSVSPGEAYSFAFVESGDATAGGKLRPPAVPPFEEHNGRYTCGSSVYIGSEKGAGTLGCLVSKDGSMFGLSNNHVVGGSNYAPVGLPIVIPGGCDVSAGGKDPETVGHLFTSYPLIDGLPEIVDCDGNLDAAVFVLSDVNRLSSMQREVYDTPASVKTLEESMVVEKVGRTSGYTKGTVIAEIIDYTNVLFTVDIFNGKKVVYFKEMFVVKSEEGAFSAPGDSGSLVVNIDKDGERHAVGLVVAGDDEGNSFILSLDRILTHFGATIVTGHNV